MLKDFLEAALEVEMSVHLDEQERQSGNKRNGKGSKSVKTFAGEIDMATTQDRHSNLAPKIIALYGSGMSFRDISEHVKEMYDVDISHATLSEITERIFLRSQNAMSPFGIACIDNLKGFAEAIETVFQQVEIQSCIIHQIRNTIKYVSNKDQREFLADLNFEKFSKKWTAKYP